MKREDTLYQQYLQILQEELIPAMGCTEPIAIAYGAAKAREILGTEPEKIVVDASGNLIKNVKSVVVPNTGGLKGIEAAAAVGAVAGKADKELEVIASVTEKEQQALKTYLESHEVEVNYLESEFPFDLIISMEAEGHTSKIRIAQYHTNIVLEEKDGQVLMSKNSEVEEEGLMDRSVLNVKDILEFAETVVIDDVREVIGRQIEYNMAIAEEGLKNNYGANIGSVLLNLYGIGIKNHN